MMGARVLVCLLFAFALSLPNAAHAEKAWEQLISSALGVQGAELPGGVYKISLPRSDLKVTVDGIQIRPALALGSWMAFKSTGNQAIVMGDLVLTESEVLPVMKRLEDAKIAIIMALHNHLMRATPSPMYLHISGHGEPGKLAAALRNALDASKTPLTKSPAGPEDQRLDLDTASIDKALGHKGKISGGVYQVSISRATPINDNGMAIPASMGTTIAINFQPTGNGKAATTGDFVLTAEEVNPVLKALNANGIEVTALHNHMLTEQPRTFFMHFWANDDATKLARGLRSALDKVNVTR